MNSERRCGRSDSSTTDSSTRTSGVVISARDIGGNIPDQLPKYDLRPVCRAGWLNYSTRRRGGAEERRGGPTSSPNEPDDRWNDLGKPLFQAPFYCREVTSRAQFQRNPAACARTQLGVQSSAPPRLCVEQFPLPALDSCPEPRQSLRRIVERRLLLTEREARVDAPVFLVRVEARARHRRHTDLGGHPLRERHVIEIADLREVDEHEVGAFGRRELEALFAQHAAEEIAALAIVVAELVVVLGAEREADGGGGLKRRGCAHREEVVDLADRSRLRRRRDDPAHPPARAAVSLWQAGE